MFITLVPCLYVLLCGPKIRNEDSCIMYLIPQHAKYVKRYIVFDLPSICLFICPSVCHSILLSILKLTFALKFYVKFLFSVGSGAGQGYI